MSRRTSLVVTAATVIASLALLAVALEPLSAQTVSSNGSRVDTLSASERAQIDAVFKDYDKPNVPGCALGVMRDGRLVYGRGYGLADLELNVPITTASLFDIGSTSKQFAAASIALLAEDGKLSFSDDVRKYIPELPNYDRTITIDNLMRHTSGLRDYTSLLVLEGYTLEEVTTDSEALAAIVHQQHLNFPTGTRWEYSNTGYFLLSVIVKRVSGQSLADFAHERIFVPLGMTHTMYRDKFAMLIPNRALGYAPDGSTGFRNSMSNWEQTGDGALQLSIDDALKWDENFYQPKVGGAWMVQQLQARGTLANGDSLEYARGLFINKYRRLRREEHGGDWIGYHAAFTRFPDQHTSVVLLCNSDGISPTSLVNKVADIVLAGVFPEPKKTSSAGHKAATTSATSLTHNQVVGSYYFAPTDDVIRVADSAGTLLLQYSGLSLPLMPSGPSTLSTAAYPISVDFVTNGRNPAGALRLRLGSDNPEEAARFTPATPIPTELRDYAGSYYSPELGVTWPLVVESGKLILNSPHSALVDIRGELHPAMRDAFTAGSGFIRFTRDGFGRVTGFELSASRMRGIRFDLRTESPAGRIGTDRV